MNPSRYELLVEMARVRAELVKARSENLRLREDLHERQVQRDELGSHADRLAAQLVNRDWAGRNSQPFGAPSLSPAVPVRKVQPFNVLGAC